VPLEKDKHFMKAALKSAKKAWKNGEVPVGAVLVKNGEIISTGQNSPITSNDPTAHAEIIALREGSEKLKNYRLIDTTLYVTIEPCTMCMGAIIHARIKKLVFGAFDPRAGAAGSLFDFTVENKFNHKVEVKSGILESECRELVQDFFKHKRSKQPGSESPA
jgi:tRNA(adenine34) deaminase